MLEEYYIFIIAFLFGLKHALEPDHLVAISTIAYKQKKPFKAASNGLIWGIGHTFTIFLMGFLVLFYKLSISDSLALWLERSVGIMIIFLGLKPLISYKKAHFHRHEYNHKKPFIVGVIQGLAGSATMIILTISTATTTFQGLIFIIVFGIGTVVAMFLYTLIISYSINQVSRNSFQIQLNFIVGILSTAFGIYYISII